MALWAGRALVSAATRIALVVAIALTLTLLGVARSPGALLGPGSAEAHARCYSPSPTGENCVFAGHYGTRKACRRHGRRALRAEPWPRLDWEHYHCWQVNGPSNVWALNLYDLGRPG
jgi:hypothetical protein